MWIPLEARHLNSFKNSFKETCKYVFSYILDDKIICFWWLGIFECPIQCFSAAFDVLIKISESYRPQIPSRTTYKIPIGMSPFRLIFRKAYHLPIELELRAYWAIKKLNLSLDEARKHRLLQLQELQELRHDAYENATI